MSCVFISSELDEVLRTSHRIVVLRDRAKVAEFSGEVDEQGIMQAIAGAGGVSAVRAASLRTRLGGQPAAPARSPPWV